MIYNVKFLRMPEAAQNCPDAWRTGDVQRGVLEVRKQAPAGATPQMGDYQRPILLYAAALDIRSLQQFQRQLVRIGVLIDNPFDAGVDDHLGAA